MKRIGIFARLTALTLLFVALATTSALAIPRDVVITRGRVWVDLHVPYSQTRYATVGGSLVPTATPNPSTVGYRTDCSGFVSMCYNLRYDSGAPKSLTTRSLPGVSESISKASLAHGDMMLKPGTHVVIFWKWADEAHTQYWTLEEGSTATGTISRLRTYANDYANGLRPYRYTGIEDDFADVLDPVSGTDRYVTAVQASKVAFPEGAKAPALVVASGRGWADALGGAALAGASGGPLLLSDTDRLPASTRAEIIRLAPAKVYVLGGPNVLTGNVAAELDTIVDKVVRLGGPNRYATSALVAQEAAIVGHTSTRTVDAAFVATGKDFPDALAASPIAARAVRPVLLTEPGRLSAETAQAITRMKLTSVTVLGGDASVAPAVETSLGKLVKTVERIESPNRYQTALRIADAGSKLGLSWRFAAVGSGTSYADALSGGVAQGLTGSVLVLTPGTRLDAGVGATIKNKAQTIERPRVLGGTSVVTTAVREDLAEIFRPLLP